MTFGATATWLTGAKSRWMSYGSFEYTAALMPCDPGVAHDERVAVGRRLGDCVRTDHAPRARPVLDHDLLAERSRELVGDEPRDHVGRIARRAGRDEPDRLVRDRFARARRGRP